MHVRLNNFSRLDQRKYKQHNLAISTSQMCMEAEPPLPKNTSTSNWNTEQGHGHTNWMKMLAMLISRKTSLDVWNINSDWTDRCRTLLVKATGISSFCCTSMVHVLTISHNRDQGIMLKQWIASQIWLDISPIGQTYNTIDQNCNWYLFTRHA